jgi:hypothetical protein
MLSTGAIFPKRAGEGEDRAANKKPRAPERRDRGVSKVDFGVGRGIVLKRCARQRDASAPLFPQCGKQPLAFRHLRHPISNTRRVYRGFCARVNDESH